jgi:hypothetical protein
MFCETEREILLFELLTEKFPKQHPHLLQLIAWCGINRPERLTEIMEQHAKDGDALIDLESLDIKGLCPTPSVRFSITDEVAEIKLDD